MVSLVDIAGIQVEKSVPIRGLDLPIVGLTAEDIAFFLARFNELEQLLEGEENLTAKMLIQRFPDAMAVLAAMGTGSPGDKNVEDSMRKLRMGEQITIINAIIEETFGDKIGPLLEKVRDLVGSGRGALGKARGMTRPLPSKASLQSATTPEMFGATHPGNSEATPS